MISQINPFINEEEDIIYQESHNGIDNYSYPINIGDCTYPILFIGEYFYPIHLFSIN